MSILTLFGQPRNACSCAAAPLVPGEADPRAAEAPPPAPPAGLARRYSDTSTGSPVRADS